MKSFKAALFDLDGTLVDTEHQYTIFWAETGKKYRPDVPNLAQAIKGTTLVQIFQRYFPDKQWQREITEALDRWEARMTYDIIPGALDFVRDIRSHGVKCAIVTSSNIKKMDVFRNRQPEFCALFDRILTSEDFAASKPNPDCYLKGAETFGCTIDEGVVFEDAFTGLQAGMSAGIFTVGLTTYNSREAISSLCNHAIDNFVGLTYDGVTDILDSHSG